jgi:transposase
MKHETRQKKVVRRAFPKERRDLIRIIRERDEQVAALEKEKERLRKKSERLENRLEDANRRIQDANRQIDDLLQKLEEAQRAAHRQAAPFRIPETKRKTNPKRPGRAKGHPGVCRPKPDHVDEEQTVEMRVCPKCGGPVHDVEPVEQFIEDLPVVRPRVTRLVTHVGQCARCGEVRTTDPLQVSTATRAAGTHLGPRALAVAIGLNQPHGLSMRKTCAVMKDLFGLSLTAGALAQAKQRLAGKLQGPYDGLLEQARQSSVLHADETSWYVASPKWWLWVFTNPDLTYYAVRNSRARSVLLDVIGEDFDGVLNSDCLSIYDLVERILQHKCYAHHHHAISEAAHRHPQGETPHLRALRDLLRTAQQLKVDQPTLDAKSVRSRRRSLERTARRLILPPRADPIEEAVTNRLRKQFDHLFTFLDHPDVPATNNLAERQLRPAVIARKISCGNRTPAGAHAWELLASLAATAHQRGASFLDLLDKSARLNPPP